MKRLTDEIRKAMLNRDRDPKAFDILNEIEKRIEDLERENEMLRSQISEKKK